MSEGRFLILKLPIDPEAPIGWLRMTDGAVIAAGGDLVAIPMADDVQLAEEQVIALTPAQDVTINRAVLAGLAPAQARAAARLLASESSIAPVDSLHVAIGEPEGEGEDRLIATVDRARMDHWLARTQALGFDPDVMLPISLLLPRPEQGYVRGTVFGQPIIAGRNSAFADEDGLTALIVGDAPVEALGDDAVRAGIGAILAAPPVNLRQGDYAKRRRWQLDWPLVRRLLLIGLVLALVTLLISLASIFKHHSAADALELRTADLARTVVPGASSDEGAIRQLDERLAAERGGAAGFAATTAAIFAAVRAVPNVELTAYDFGVDGTLRVTIAAAGAADVAALQQQLERYGFDGTASQPQQVAGRQVVEMMVKLP